MQNNLKKLSGQSKTRNIVFVALAVALISVSSWVSVPIGAVPFTLQIFAIAFMLLVLKPKQMLAAICLYILLGAFGLPIFSSMRGGAGVLAGPTGGFLWGYVLGVVCALLLKRIKIQNSFVKDVAVCVLFLLVTYACGWVQLMFVSALTPLQAFLTGIAPFVAFDVIKIVFACICAKSVRAAIGL